MPRGRNVVGGVCFKGRHEIKSPADLYMPSEDQRRCRQFMREQEKKRGPRKRVAKAKQGRSTGKREWQCYFGPDLRCKKCKRKFEDEDMPGKGWRYRVCRRDMELGRCQEAA